MWLLSRLCGPPVAEPGKWFQSYFLAWMAVHDPVGLARNARTNDLEGGCWAGSWSTGNAWVTGTPDWDKQWFRDNGMDTPRIVDKSRTHWTDYGGGLRKLDYH